MKEFFRKVVLPPGPILVFTLLGVMLLSALLYSRAIRVQRFLEPALAVSQPRTLFYNNVSRILIKEFGEGDVTGIKFIGHSIFIEKSKIFQDPYHMEASDTLKNLGRVFLAVLKDPVMRSYVDIIVVSKRISLVSDREVNKTNRQEAQSRAGLMLDALFGGVPELERDYAIYFESSATSIYAKGDETNWVEFRIVQSDRIHIDVLQRLQKYIL